MPRSIPRNLSPALLSVTEAIEARYSRENDESAFESDRVYASNLVADGTIPAAYVDRRPNGRPRCYWISASAAVLVMVALQLRGMFDSTRIAEVLRKISAKYDVADERYASTVDYGHPELDAIVAKMSPTLADRIADAKHPGLTVYLDMNDASPAFSLVSGTTQVSAEWMDEHMRAIFIPLKTAQRLVRAAAARTDLRKPLDLDGED